MRFFDILSKFSLETIGELMKEVEKYIHLDDASRVKKQWELCFIKKKREKDKQDKGSDRKMQRDKGQRDDRDKKRKATIVLYRSSQKGLHSTYIFQG